MSRGGFFCSGRFLGLESSFFLSFWVSLKRWCPKRSALLFNKGKRAFRPARIGNRPLSRKPASYWEKSSSIVPPGREKPAVETLAFSGREESNENFYMEFLVRDPRANEFDFDIPIVINARVELFIECFQTTARERFATWARSSQKYIPLMKNVFKSHGLPEDLV